LPPAAAAVYLHYDMARADREASPLPYYIVPAQTDPTNPKSQGFQKTHPQSPPKRIPPTPNTRTRRVNIQTKISYYQPSEHLTPRGNAGLNTVKSTTPPQKSRPNPPSKRIKQLKKGGPVKTHPLKDQYLSLSKLSIDTHALRRSIARPPRPSSARLAGSGTIEAA
jgi:hypothetical protein